MYKSPIEILTDDIHAQIVKLEEDQIFKAVVNVGIKVDKKELLRALRYDRQQYAVGYIEGKADATPKWIPVEEGFPNLVPCNAGTAYSEAVNVLTSGRKVLTAIWDGFEWICDAEFWDAEDEEITHWTPVLLPLPEPPKGGKL